MRQPWPRTPAVGRRDNKRTLTFECVEDGELLTISYSQVKQIYFQNPVFGFYFLQLISQRLFKDIERLQ